MLLYGPAVPFRIRQLAALGIMFSGACRPGIPADAVHHPQATYLARDVDPSEYIQLGEPPIGKGEADLLLGRTVDTVFIGALDSPAEEVFGSIAQATRDARGRFIVLEERSSQVRVFSRTGAFLFTVGGPGRGPGEFTNPLSLAIDHAGQLLVADLTRQIHLFTPVADSFVYARSIGIGVSAQAMCVMGETVVVHGLHLERPEALHEFTLMGSPLRSFGAVYESPSPIINYTLSQGRLACSEGNGLIVFAPISGIGEVYAFDTLGSQVWATKFKGFQPTDLIEVANGYGVQVPEAGFNSIRSLALLDDRHLLVQVAYKTRESMERADEFAELHSFVLSTTDGQGRYLGPRLAPVVASGSGYRIAVTVDPYPSIAFDSVVVSPRVESHQ